MGATAASAQTQPIPDLAGALPVPRRGYEPRTLRLGSTEISTDLAVGVRYDSNIFGLPGGVIADTIAIVEPHVVVTGGNPRLAFNADLHADLRTYANYPNENQQTFGIRLGADSTASRRWQFLVRANADRVIENRGDPQASSNRGLPPRDINVFGGEIAVRRLTGSIVAQLAIGIDRFAYLPITDRDQTLNSYHGNLRLSYSPSPGIALFVEPFVARRDNDQRLDRSGVNRDTLTFGGLAGVRFDLTNLLRGDVGLGAFRANPDDARLAGYTGFAADVRLRWTPRKRTAIGIDLSSGDTATIVVGAIGRTDQAARLRVDQEIQHNLLVGIGGSWLRTVFRGASYSLTTWGVDGSIEALIDRHLSVVFEVSQRTRTSDLATERYDRTYAGVALRFRH